jgi:hypothetical protein
VKQREISVRAGLQTLGVLWRPLGLGSVAAGTALVLDPFARGRRAE